MMAQLLFGGQHIRVVLPALLRQLEPFSQQKSFGQSFSAL
jgi:hypothetical protein